MATRVDLKREGRERKSYVGFSWTTFFFGFFVPLFRGDIIWFIIMAFGDTIFAFLTGGLAIPFFHLLLSIFYNKMYTQNLLGKGYGPATERSEAILRNRGYRF